MASIKWEPNVSQIVYGDLIEESIFSATAIYQDADGDDHFVVPCGVGPTVGEEQGSAHHVCSLTS